MDYYAQARAHELPCHQRPVAELARDRLRRGHEQGLHRHGACSASPMPRAWPLDDILTARRAARWSCRSGSTPPASTRPPSWTRAPDSPGGPAARTHTVEGPAGTRRVRFPSGDRLTAFLSDTFSSELGLKAGQLDEGHLLRRLRCRLHPARAGPPADPPAPRRAARPVGPPGVPDPERTGDLAPRHPSGGGRRA